MNAVIKVVGVLTVVCIAACVTAGAVYISSEKPLRETKKMPTAEIRGQLTGLAASEISRMNLNHLTAKEKICFFDYSPVLFQGYTESGTVQWIGISSSSPSF
jgi:hypothetical protein